MPRRAGALAQLLLAALLLAAPLAAAHALPLQTTPPSGAVVQVPPREVVIKFSERLEPAYSGLEVRDANGTTVSQPHTIDADGITMRAVMPAALPYGTYTVVWRALSAADGHSTRGIASFLFPDPSKPLTAADLARLNEAQQETVGSPLDAALRGMAFVGLYAAFGGAAVMLLVVRGEARPAPWRAERALGTLCLGAAWVGALATVLLAASQAASAAQVGLGEALARPALAFGGRFGLLAGARAGLLAAAGLLAWAAAREGLAARAGRTLWAAAGALALAALATVSLSSHAAALRGFASGPAVFFDIVHLAAGAAWVGGLVGLAAALWRPGADPGQAWPRLASRFSALATVCVGAVVLTGVAAALLYLPSLDALFGSGYGQALVAKLVLVAGLLALGGYHRTRAVPAIAREGPDGPARHRFQRTLQAEAVFGVSVLLAAGLLTALSPPPAVAPEAAPSVLELTQFQDGVNATLIVSPNPVTVGLATLDLFLTIQGASEGVNATNATLTFLPPDRSLGSSSQKMTQTHENHFATEGGFFTLPGTWTVRAVVQRGGAFDLVVEYEIEVVGG
ncbi:MAG TPA: CopD family protein [Candidatus Thermoplasmatota archaeon]|jgi:copper transport protein|nr:CopD family protein [Candidatus Thermoplasmatota archaeon]